MQDTIKKIKNPYSLPGFVLESGFFSQTIHAWQQCYLTRPYAKLQTRRLQHNMLPLGCSVILITA